MTKKTRALLAEKHGEEPESLYALKARLPQWARDVRCPVCRGLMTPISAKHDTQWGESVTYQCHNEKPFVVMTLTTSVPNMMRPGDFTKSDFDWRRVAPEGIPMDEVEIKPHKEIRLSKAPPSPWTREVNSKVIWDEFWQMFVKLGFVHKDTLMEEVIKRKKDSPQLRELLQTVNQWITERSGFAILDEGDSWEVVARTVGGSEPPYSDPAYRKEFGFDEPPASD